MSLSINCNALKQWASESDIPGIADILSGPLSAMDSDGLCTIDDDALEFLQELNCPLVKRSAPLQTDDWSGMITAASAVLGDNHSLVQCLQRFPVKHKPVPKIVLSQLKAAAPSLSFRDPPSPATESCDSPTENTQRRPKAKKQRHQIRVQIQ